MMRRDKQRNLFAMPWKVRRLYDGELVAEFDSRDSAISYVSRHAHEGEMRISYEPEETEA